MVTCTECDVLTVGGGAAGIAAAVAAARSGASVVLLEKYGFFGGLATAGMVGTICGLYVRDPAKARYAAGGFAREWAERLARTSASLPEQVSEGLHVLPCDPWAFARLADAVVGETPGLTPVLHGVLTGVTVHGARAAEARCLVWNREVAIRPQCIVDCTGEATAVRLAGGQVEDPAAPQAAGMVFRMDGVDEAVSVPAGRIAALREIVRGVQDGRLPPACGQVSFVPGAAHGGRVYLKLALLPTGDVVQASRLQAPDWQARCLPHPGDWNGMTALELGARERVDQLARFLAEAVPHFRGARLGQAAPQVGIRVGTRACGRATLTEDDVLSCRAFPDGVACGAWPIEEWRDTRRPRMRPLPEGGRYEIPMGCLVAEKLENVLVAGRCISATPGALASARVIATAMATGWAAGTAAAFLARGRPLASAVAQARKDQVAETDERP